jgi:hypothetical protein
MQRRNRFKQTTTLEERLDQAGRRLREQAKRLPPGPERDEFNHKARQVEAASRLSDWLATPGSPPPE